MRFFVVFLFMFTCFWLSGHSGILSTTRLPDTPIMAALAALAFAYLTYDANPWMAGLVCGFIFIANLPASAQAPIFPDPNVSLSIAITLALFPRFRAMIER